MSGAKDRADRPADRVARWGLLDGLRSAGLLGARAVLASLVLASGWTTVTLGRLLRRRAAVG